MSCNTEREREKQEEGEFQFVSNYNNKHKIA